MAYYLVHRLNFFDPLQITPEMLKNRLNAGEKLGIIDLLRFEEDPEGVAATPGAVRLDLREIRRKKQVVMSTSVGLVVYCRSKNSLVSARVALAMHKHGIQNIHVLAGGMDAWQSHGFTLSSEFADPEKELARLGIEVLPPWQLTHGK